MFCSTEKVAQDFLLCTAQCFCSPPELCQTSAGPAPGITRPPSRDTAEKEPGCHHRPGGNLHHPAPFCTGSPRVSGKAGEARGQRCGIWARIHRTVGISLRQCGMLFRAAGGAKWLCLCCRVCSCLNPRKPPFPCKGRAWHPHGAVAAGRDVCPSPCLSMATTGAANPACQGFPLLTDQNSLAASSPLGQQAACPAEEP